MKRLFLSLIITLCMAVPALCGCGKTGSAEVPEPDDTIETGDVTITIQPYVFMDLNTKLAISMYEEKHPNVKFEVLPDYDYYSQDVTMNEIYAEMSQGGGPDIIELSKEQLYKFAENDCLIELSHILDKEDLEFILPSVVTNGEINGNVYMLSSSLNTYSVIVNKKYLTKNTWSVSDVLDIIDSHSENGKPFTWVAAAHNGSGGIGYPLLSLLTHNIDESAFIDYGSMSASFNSDEFIRVLNASKSYDQYENRPMYRTDDELFNALKNDEILCIVESNLSSFFNFSHTAAILGPDFVYAGFPCDTANGNNVVFARGYAVNKNTTHYGIIKDFLKFVYSKEFRSVLSYDELRTDVYEERIVYDEITGQYGVALTSGDEFGYNVLDCKEDGTPYTEEYFDFLKNCTPTDQHGVLDFVFDLIVEESLYLSTGEKTPEEIADTIQRRVTIYLEERK